MRLFISAVWQALKEVLPPYVVIKGCSFHWRQSVYRKITTLGLSSAYMARKDKFIFMRKLMALPFLPQEHIYQAFNKLREQAAQYGIQPLIDLTTYINTTWITSSVWTPGNWSAFRETGGRTTT